MKQSYIDIVLSGCLDIGGKQFAKEFVQNTFGWTPFMIWNDDRGHSKIFKYEESKHGLRNYLNNLNINTKYIIQAIKNIII